MVRWRLVLGRRLRVGENVSIGAEAVLLSPNELTIGSNVSIGREFHVETDLEIGGEVLISSRVAIVGRDHRFDDPHHSVYWAGRLAPGKVVLEGDNLIGFGTIVIGPARIARGCIVGAGSVVVGDLPPNTICAGVPARPIRSRYPGHREVE
jgi:acetyltransferase-like isoleucine patch superfamily enzyme